MKLAFINEDIFKPHKSSSQKGESSNKFLFWIRNSLIDSINKSAISKELTFISYLLNITKLYQLLLLLLLFLENGPRDFILI